MCCHVINLLAFFLFIVCQPWTCEGHNSYRKTCVFISFLNMKSFETSYKNLIWFEDRRVQARLFVSYLDKNLIWFEDRRVQARLFVSYLTPLCGVRYEQIRICLEPDSLSSNKLYYQLEKWKINRPSVLLRERLGSTNQTDLQTRCTRMHPGIVQQAPG